MSPQQSQGTVTKGNTHGLMRMATWLRNTHPQEIDAALKEATASLSDIDVPDRTYTNGQGLLHRGGPP